MLTKYICNQSATFTNAANKKKLATNLLNDPMMDALQSRCVGFGRKFYLPWQLHEQHEAEKILQAGFIKVLSCLHQHCNEGSLQSRIRRLLVTGALQHSCSQVSSLYTVLLVVNGKLQILSIKKNGKKMS